MHSCSPTSHAFNIPTRISKPEFKTPLETFIKHQHSQPFLQQTTLPGRNSFFVWREYIV